MRAATSLLLLLVPVAVFAQAFGRFGYVPQRNFAGIVFSETGLTTESTDSGTLRFPGAVGQFKPVATNDVEQTVWLGDPEEGKPSKLRTSLLTPGISLFYEKGVRFHSTATAAPYLSWTDGSVSDGVPTPTVRWLALSYRDSQPALILGMPAGGNFQIKGRPGDWTLESPNYQGWLRVGLPRGLQSEPTNTAAALGRLANTCKKVATYFANDVPQLLDFRAEAEPDGSAVIGTWIFDQPGVLVPQAVSLAALGGYPIAVQSKVHRHNGDMGLGFGPRDICDEPVLKVRFPLRRVPIGRALAIGEIRPPLGTASSLDIPSVVDLGLDNLLGDRDAQTRKTAEDVFADFLSGVATAEEPYSRQRLTYDAEGNGLDLTAAHAFLMQAMITTTKSSSEENALLTSVGWRTDWDSWLPWVTDSDRRRRTAALAALAGAICPEPRRRLEASMLQAGLAAERGKEILRRRAGIIPKESPLLEPALELRTALFRLTLPQSTPDPFVETLLSPYRVFSSESVQLTEVTGSYQLTWPVLEPKAGTLTLAAATPVELDPVLNLPRFLVERVLGLSEVRYTPGEAGPCVVRLALPSLGVRPPKLSPAKPYSERKL